MSFFGSCYGCMRVFYWSRRFTWVYLLWLRVYALAEPRKWSAESSWLSLQFLSMARDGLLQRRISFISSLLTLVSSILASKLFLKNMLLTGFWSSKILLTCMGKQIWCKGLRLESSLCSRRRLYWSMFLIICSLPTSWDSYGPSREGSCKMRLVW